MSERNAAILLEEVSLSYDGGKFPALQGVSAQFAEGGITGVLGPDGAGKTTLMRILAGLLLPDSGAVYIHGQALQKVKKIQPNYIGYMPQRFGLYEDLTVADNLHLYADLVGLEGEAREATFKRLLRFTSLAPFTERLAANLSGGMKQKLGIACALLGKPRLLLLDEPGVGVDPRSRLELWEMVQSLADDGMTVFWATSYMDEADKCPQLLVLEKGRALYCGEPQKLADQVKGKVYFVPHATDGAEKRAALTKWSIAPGIIDVTIDGNFMRLEVGGKESERAERAIIANNGKLTDPTLGDAYMAAVGGIDKRPSPYAAIPHIGEPENSNARIVAKHLTKKFGDFTAAKDISFQVRAGEIIGLLGPNGAGKSTIFRMLCGLLRPTSGSCSVDGVDLLASGSAARNKLGYMAQKFSLYMDISVWENLYISARLYGLKRSYIRDFGGEMAQALELSPYLSTRTADLPLGMKQRLALLCATLHLPPVLFLDEPTSGVDMRTRRDFWKHISALTNAGTAVLVTTHFMEEAEYCDNIALIYRGEMISYGSPQSLKATVSDSQNATIADAFIACIDEYDKKHPI